MERFDIIFDGEVCAGYDYAKVLQAVQKRFELDDRATAQLFSGQRLTLHRDLPRDQAVSAKHALEKLGMQVRLEWYHAPPGEEPPPQPPEATPEPARMTCPQCGQEQAPAEDCVACGVLIRDYLEKRSRERTRRWELAMAGREGTALDPAATPTPIMQRPALPPLSMAAALKLTLAAMIILALLLWAWLRPEAIVVVVAPTLEQIHEAHVEACANSANCETLVARQWDRCVVRSDYATYDNAEAGSWIQALEAFAGRLNRCLVDQTGQALFNSQVDANGGLVVELL